MAGTRERRRTVGAPNRLANETLFFQKKTSVKVLAPRTKRIGETKRTYPAKHATHLPPLKWE